MVGDCAVQIKPSSSQEIESAVINLFNNQKKKKELSSKGRERMEDMFDWKIAASRYERSFEEVIRKFKNEYN